MDEVAAVSNAEPSEMVIEPLGDFAYLIRNLTDPWRYTVDLPGVLELVPSRYDLGVYLDPSRNAVSVKELLGALRSTESSRTERRTIEIPVWYDGEDLPELNDRIGTSAANLHQSATYQVQFIGFMPGFPYLTGLPSPLLGIPRRSAPRPRVPAGSVAIADEYSGIYPAESPGGWWLIGRTPIPITDPENETFLLQPGDKVRFRAITCTEFEAYR
jgi:KipI family sensor histidine kinase inhibitor